MFLAYNNFWGFSFAFLRSPVKIQEVKLKGIGGEQVGVWQRRTVGPHASHLSAV